MKRTAKTPIALLMTLGLALAGQAVLPSVAQATIPLTMAGLTSLGTPGLYDLSTADQPVVNVTADGVAVTGTQLSLSLRLTDGVTLTLVNAEIRSLTPDSPINASACTAAGCHLVLVGTNTVTSTGRSAAVSVTFGRSLSITGPGRLTANGGLASAGIGGGTDWPSGSITINHATVVAVGGSDVAPGIGGGAGIGGSAGGSGGPIQIINSSVTATGGAGVAGQGGGAGIGGGGSGNISLMGGAGHDITVTASTVVATGGAGGVQGGGGAGIGGGGSVNNVLGAGGDRLSVDANSVVQAKGGAGGNGGGSGGSGGGGGAAIGSGGTGAWYGALASASDLAIAGANLAVGSAGGSGGISGGGGGGVTNGGSGALCGTGGSGTGVNGMQLTLVAGGTCSLGTQVVNPSSRPDPNYPGYPAAPVFTDPSSFAVPAGGTATPTVAPHSGAYLFQWQLSTDGGATWNDIAPSSVYSGTTTDALRLTAVTQAMNGYQYRCLVGNSVVQDVASQAATMTVLTPVTFTAIQVGGASGTANSTGIQLTFS